MATVSKKTVLILLFALVGCGGGRSNNPNNPKFQPEITNLTDDFRFQATKIGSVSDTLLYTWQNTGIAANITQSSQIAQGTAVLTLRDANGMAVYQADLTNNGTFTSISGTSGNWTVQVSLTNVSGTINFQVQRGG